MDTYDLVVIGSGPAGEKSATQAADRGLSVCVIDAGPSGGAWVNTGTIPSKTLRESARLLARGRNSGVIADPSANPTVRSFLSLNRHLVAMWREQVEARFRARNIARARGRARFVDPNVLELDTGKRIRGTYIVIATGSSPRAVPQLPVDGHMIQDSNTILALDHIPHSMIVLGGGVVACEYASIFQALGVQVTLINGRGELLGFMDQEAIDYLQSILKRGGMAIRHNARPESLGRTLYGEMDLNLSDGTVVSADMIFVALGRTPNTADLNLEAAGLDITDWGAVDTNDYMQTAVPHIYAVGDVVGFPSLASAGMEQGRVAANHLSGGRRAPLDELIPSGIYTIPEVSSIGLDETTAREKGHDLIVGKAQYEENVRSHMLMENEGLVKLVADKRDGKLLGASVVGTQATELVHFAQAVIKYGGTVTDLQRFVFNVPTLSALFRQAAETMET